MPVTDQGSSVGRYTFVPRTLIFITRREQVLLIKGAPHKRLWAGFYNGIGGHVEKGEDILSSAQREVLEETGLKVSNLGLCGILTVDTTGDSGILIFILRGESPGGEPRSSPEGEVEWIDFKEVEHLPLVEDLPFLLPRVLSFRVGDPPFYALYSYDSEGRLIISFAE